jgi:hypothetical protein
MRRSALTILGLLALVLPATSTAATTTRGPLAFDVLACNGDTIHLSGMLLTTSSFTATPSGGFMLAFHAQPQDVSGVDLQTGEKFRGTGLTRDVIVVAPSFGFVATTVNLFHIQATAGGQSFDVSEVVHLTATPDGSVSVFFDDLKLPC